MACAIPFAALLEAYEWVSAGIEMQAQAYVSRTTGKIFRCTASGEFGDIEDELPHDVEDESLYVSVPNQHDLDLGKALVFRFVRERLPEAHARVERIFARRGAYGQFKGLLEDAGLLASWYEFEAQSVEAALRDWAKEEGLGFDDEPAVRLERHEVPARLLAAIPKLASLEIERSLAFFGTLGFNRRRAYPDYGIVERDGVQVHFWLCQDPRIPTETACRISVEGIEQLFETYSALGIIHPNGSLEAKPWGVLEFSILDPDGNLVTFQQPAG